MSEDNASWANAEAEEKDQSLPALVKVVIAQFKNLLQAEVALLKAKATQFGKTFAAAIAFFAVAIFMAIYLLWWLFHSVELAFALIVPEWAAALITSGILLVLIIICGLVGVAFAKNSRREVPAVAETVETDTKVVKEGLER